MGIWKKSEPQQPIPDSGTICRRCGGDGVDPGYWEGRNGASNVSTGHPPGTPCLDCHGWGYRCR